MRRRRRRLFRQLGALFGDSLRPACAGEDEIAEGVDLFSFAEDFFDRRGQFEIADGFGDFEAVFASDDLQDFGAEINVLPAQSGYFADSRAGQ